MFMTRQSEKAKIEKICVRRHRAAAHIRRAVFAGIVLHACPGSTAEPVWRTGAMHYFARDTPLPKLLNEVASAGGIPMKIAPGLKDPVNGMFDDPPARVFARLIEAYGLSWYFDGRMIHVSPAADTRSMTIPFAPLTRDAVATILSNLGLDDSHLPIRYSDTTAIVSGPAEYVDAVSDAVAQSQRQAAANPVSGQMVIRVFPLRHAQAQDIAYTSGNQQQLIPGVASLLRKLMADVPVAAPRREAPMRLRTNARTARGGPPPMPSLRGLGLIGAATETADVPLPDSDGDTSVPPAGPMRRNIVADARTNSIVIYDLPAMMPAYATTIAMLDKPQDIVEITAAVIDVTSEAANELGIRWGGAVRGRSGSASAAANMMAVAQPAAAMMPGVNLATMIGSSANALFARIGLLEKTGKAHILSRPQVLTLNNTEAVLSSRSSLYVKVAGNQDVDLFNVDTGLTLKVTPTVEPGAAARGRNILLSIQIEDGAFDSSLSVDGIPKVSHNNIVTQAVIADGESLLVGGYEYERTATVNSQVPVLGDLPLLGDLFRSKDEQTQRFERLILITPRIKLPTGPDAPAAANRPVVNARAAPRRNEAPAYEMVMPGGAADARLRTRAGAPMQPYDGYGAGRRP